MQLEHANITVASVDESVRFLETAFPGARIRGQGFLHGDPAKGRWLHFGEESFYIALQQNTLHSGRQDETYQNDGINHIGFVVTELDQLLSRMEAMGYQMTPASEMDSHPYRRRAYVYDGNGVEWEFVEYLSSVSEQKNDYNL